MHKHANHNRGQAHRNNDAGRGDAADGCGLAILGAEQRLHIGLSGNNAYNHGAQAKKTILHTASEEAEPGVRRQSSSEAVGATHAIEGEHTAHENTSKNKNYFDDTSHAAAADAAEKDKACGNQQNEHSRNIQVDTKDACY